MCKYPFRDFCVAYFISRSETNCILDMKKLSISFFNSLIFLEISTLNDSPTENYLGKWCIAEVHTNTPALNILPLNILPLKKSTKDLFLKKLYKGLHCAQPYTKTFLKNLLTFKNIFLYWGQQRKDSLENGQRFFGCTARYVREHAVWIWTHTTCMRNKSLCREP